MVGKQKLMRPINNDDREGWLAYWDAFGEKYRIRASDGIEYVWRTEPEIDGERQAYLNSCRAIKPDFENGIYPFRAVKLDRADVEWLLATHESGDFIGPVVWSNPTHRSREGLDLRGANLQRSDLRGLPLARLRAGLSYSERGRTPPQMREYAAVHLERADVSAAYLEHANLSWAHCEEAILRETHLAEADLFRARLDGATLTEAHLDKADLRFAYFDTETYLRGVILTTISTGPCLLAGLHWGEADLSLVNWSQLSELGDERLARHPQDSEGKPYTGASQVEHYQAAVRAYRKLATVLRNQGLNEDADRFAYKAQKLQRQVLRRQHRYGAAFGSWLLDLVAGYGYKPMRTLAVYLLALISFSVAYFILGQTVGPHLSPLGAFVFSMTSFHGRGFFPGGIVLDDPITVVAAFEAFVGLVVEVSFIATFTQRFFAR